MSRPILLGALAALAVWAAQPAGEPPHAAVARLQPIALRPLEQSWPVGGDLLTLRSEPWFAGAVSSIRFRDVEFLDSADHGRLLQGAISFGGLGECLNPTQAGASRDRPGGATTSELLWAETTPERYVTATRMAYWKRPGQSCRPPEGVYRFAANQTPGSNVVYAQRFQPGYRGYANAVEAVISFTTTVDQPPAVVEALTAYTPPAFDRFHVFRDGRLVPDETVAGGPGEQPRPVVLATADGRNAIGLLSLANASAPGYGRFAFGVTNKVNLVYRPPGPYRAGTHTYRMAWVIGTLDEVEATLRGLTGEPTRRAGGGYALMR